VLNPESWDRKHPVSAKTARWTLAEATALSKVIRFFLQAPAVRILIGFCVVRDLEQRQSCEQAEAEDSSCRPPKGFADSLATEMGEQETCMHHPGQWSGTRRRALRKLRPAQSIRPARTFAPKGWRPSPKKPQGSGHVAEASVVKPSTSQSCMPPR
jgi:hypothetical protein